MPVPRQVAKSFCQVGNPPKEKEKLQRLQKLVVRPPERRLVDVLEVSVDGEAQRVGDEDLPLVELPEVAEVGARGPVFGVIFLPSARVEARSPRPPLRRRKRTPRPAGGTGSPRPFPLVPAPPTGS